MRLHYLVPFLLLLLFLNSCRSAPKTFQTPFSEELLTAEVYAVSDRASLIESLEARTRPLDQLWVKMGLTARQNGDRMAPSFTGIGVYREPQMLFGVSRFEIGTIYTILLEDEKATFYSNRDSVQWVGTIDELSEKADMLGGLSPREFVSAVQIQRNLYEDLIDDTPTVVQDKGEYLLVAGKEEKSGRQYFWLVRKIDGLVEEALVRTPSGEELFRIRYLAYEAQDEMGEATGEVYPTYCFLMIPKENIEIEANVKEYRLDPDLPPLKLPKAKKSYPMSTLEFTEPE